MDRYPAFPNAHGQVGRGRGRGSVFQPSRRLAMNEPNQGGFGRGRGDGDRYLFAQQQDRRPRLPPVDVHHTPPGGPGNHNLNTPEIFNYQAHSRVQNQADARYLSPPDRLEDPRDRNFSATSRPLNPDFADSPESYLGSPAEQGKSNSGGRDRREQYNQSPLVPNSERELRSEFNDVDQTPRPQYRRGLTRDERSDQFDLIIPFPGVVPAEYRATPTPEEQHRQAANRARNRSAQAQVYQTHKDRLRSISGEFEDSDWETTAYDDSPRDADFDHRRQPYHHLNTVKEESEESSHYHGYHHASEQSEFFAYSEPQRGASPYNDGEYTFHQEGGGPYQDGQYASPQDRSYTQVAEQSAEDADDQGKNEKKNAGFGFLLQVVKKLDPRRAKTSQVELAATQSERSIEFFVAVPAYQIHARRPTQLSQYESPQVGSFDFGFPQPNYVENSHISHESNGSGSLFPPPAPGALEGVLERHEAYLASQAKKHTESSGHQPRQSFGKTHTARNRSFTNAAPVSPPQGAQKPNFIRKATADLTTGFKSLFRGGTEDKSTKHEKKPPKEDEQITKKPERPEISAPVINATGTVPEGFNNPSLADLPQARVDQQRPEHYHRVNALQDPRWRVALAPKPSVAKRDNHHFALPAQSPKVQQGIQQQRAPHIRRLEAQGLPVFPIPKTPSRPRRFSFESPSEYGDNAPPSTQVRPRGLTLRHLSPVQEAQTTKKERSRSRSCGNLLQQFQTHQAHEYQQILPRQSNFFGTGTGSQTVLIRQQARFPTPAQQQQPFSAPLDQHQFRDRQDSPVVYRRPQQLHLDDLTVNRTRAAPPAIPPPSPRGSASSFGGAPVHSHYFGEPQSFNSREDSSELLKSGSARSRFKSDESDEAILHNEGLSVITRSASDFAQSPATHQQETQTQTTSRQDHDSDDEYDFDERPEDSFLAQFLAPQLPILHVSTDEAADEIEKTKDKTLQGLGYLIRTVKEPTRQEAEERAGPNATEEQIDLAKGHIRADRLTKQIDQLVASDSDFGSREQAHKETTKALKRASLLPGILGRPGGLTRGQSPFLANRYTPSVRSCSRAQGNHISPVRQEQVEQRPNQQTQQINGVWGQIPDWLEAQDQARRRNERAQQRESQTPALRPQRSYAETLRQQATDRALGVSTPSRQPELELSSPESRRPLRQLQESQTPSAPRPTPPRQQEAIFSSPPSRVSPPGTHTEQGSSIRGPPARLPEINNRDRIGASDSAVNIKEAALKLKPVKKSQPAPSTQSTTPAGVPRGYQQQQQRGPRIPALPNNDFLPPAESGQPRLRTVSSCDRLPQSFTTTPRGPPPGSRNASGIQTPGSRGELTSPRAQGNLPRPSDTSSADRSRLAPRVQAGRSRGPSASSDNSFGGSNSRNLRDISNVSNTNVFALARRYENAAEGNPDGSDGQKRGSRGLRSRNVSGDA